MPLLHSIKIALLAWGVPIAIVAIAVFATPRPNRRLEDFPSASIGQPTVEIRKHSGSRGSDHFELTIAGAGGQNYFHRDPEREPIIALAHRIPRGTGLKLTYEPSVEGNVLLDVRSLTGTDAPYLAFGDVMAKYVTRRRVMYWVAGIWFAIGSLIFYALFTVTINHAQPTSTNEADP